MNSASAKWKISDVGRDVRTVGAGCTLTQLSWRTWRFLEKLKIEPSRDTAMRLGRYLKEIKWGCQWARHTSAYARVTGN